MTLPLLLVSVAPLLISSFAFNFNNFTLIYMLTGGGPRFVGTPRSPLGHTDILISMVYSVSGFDGRRRSTTASRARCRSSSSSSSATISALAFRRTRKLEEIS